MAHLSNPPFSHMVSPFQVPVQATQLDRPSDVHIRWPHGDEETPAFVEVHHSAYAMGTRPDAVEWSRPKSWDVFRQIKGITGI